LQVADKKGGKGKGKEERKCWYYEKKGYVKVKCSSWLKDMDEGRKYATEYP
jgi:hypothetical protein